MIVELTRITTEPVMAIEEAASNCYDSEPSSDGKIMDSCYKSGHQSVLEFCDFTFHIEGVSRALLAQITRHRHAGFAVRSQRYCNENNFEYIIPKSIKDNEAALFLYRNTMSTLNTVYNTLTDNFKIPKEDARMVLPNACDTVLEVTMNLRELIHFMNERLCTRAQWEIRDLANAMKNEVTKSAPQFAKYLVPKCMKLAPYCFCTEQKSCGLSPKLSEVYKV